MILPLMMFTEADGSVNVICLARTSQHRTVVLADSEGPVAMSSLAEVSKARGFGGSGRVSGAGASLTSCHSSANRACIVGHDDTLHG
jgi:hypothetical protein